MILPKPVRPVKEPKRRLKRAALPQRTSRPRQRSPRRSAVEAQYARWAWMVKARDGHRCRRCGMPETAFVPLDAHHIRTKKAHPELRHVLTNGIALCRVCHRTGPESAHAKPAAFRAWITAQEAAV